MRLQLRGGTRQLKFLAAGLLAVIADYGTFFTAYTVLGLHVGVATVASYLAGFVVSFSLNKLWVFESRENTLAGNVRQLLLYGLLMAFNIAFTYFFILGLAHLFHVDPRLGKLISIAIITAWNYVAYGKLIFALRGQ